MNKEIVRKIIEWLIYIIGYALILNIVALIFKNTIHIDYSYFGIWGIIASIVIYILNKTIKPIIVRFTIPITALTLGIFYPFINLIILKIVDFILGSHFIINGIWFAVLAAILISFLNIIMDNKIIKPVIRKDDKK